MLLLGLKKKSASGTYHGTEGIEGFSMEGTEVSVIKEGTAEELKKYVDDKRALAKKAWEALDKLEDRLNREDLSLSYEEYEKKSDEYRKQLAISKFDQLIIIEGEII